MVNTKAPLAKPQREENEATTEDAADEPVSVNFAEAVKKLLKKGKARGYITVDEMNEALPQERVSSEQIEDVLSQISELGINVVEAEDVEEEASEKEDFGRTDDPVRLYLREMGAVELLSREGEIAIAKRIEAGREMMISGICESPLTIQAILDWNEALKEGRLLLRDIIDLEAMQEGDTPAAAMEEGASEEEPETPAPKEGEEGAEGGEDISGFEDEDNVSLAAIEEKLKPQVVETFDAIAATYKKMARATHARAEAMAKGEAPAKNADEKIMGFKRDLIDLVRTVRFNNARLEQLVQQLYTLNRRLMGMEGKLLRHALDCGLTREEFLERYYGHELDPGFYEHVMMEPPPPPPPVAKPILTRRDQLIADAVIRRPLTRAEQKRMEAEAKAKAKAEEKERKIAEREKAKADKAAAKEAAVAAKKAAKEAAAAQREKDRLKKDAEREKLRLKKEKERAKLEEKRERERAKKEAAREKAEAKREAERKKKEAIRLKKEKERLKKAKAAAAKAKKSAKKAKPTKKPAKKSAKKAVKKAGKKTPAKKKRR